MNTYSQTLYKVKKQKVQLCTALTSFTIFRYLMRFVALQIVFIHVCTAIVLLYSVQLCIVMCYIWPLDVLLKRLQCNVALLRTSKK